MALSWISGYNNIDYLNQMIRSVEDTLSNDYNNLDNIPIIKIISSTSNPQNIWELKEGMYLIDGIVYVDNNTSYEVSNLFVSMTARLENGKYVLSAFIPFFKGLYEYILKSNSTEYEEHQIVILATHERMLTRYNETPYEPNGNYNPATKKYVDDKANEIITELDNIGVNKETITSLKEENRIRDIKLQALLSETSDRNISISEDTRYFDMPLSIDNGIVTINEMIGDTLVNVCDQEESVAITKSYAVENENHIALQGEYDGSCMPIVYGNTLVNHNADWDDSLQTGVETSASGTEDVVVEGTRGQEVSVVVEGNTVLNHALGKTSAVVSAIESENEGNYVDLTVANDMSSIVEIEGRTMVNVCDQKDPIAITKSYTVENSGNHIALQGEYDGKCRPVIQGNTMYYNNDTDELSDTFIEEANLSLKSSFEDNLVTQEMVDSGEESEENLGKYKVEYKVTNEDNTKEYTKTFYLNSPLLEGDTIEDVNGVATHVKRYGKVVLDGSDDEGWTGATSDATNGYRHVSTILNGKGLQSGEVYCDNIKVIKQVLPGDSTNNYYVPNLLSISTNKDYIYVTTTRDLSNFKIWLSENPTTVVYQLASPIYEPISTESILCDSYVNGHLDFDSAVPIEKVEFVHVTQLLKYLNPSTKYKIQFNSDNVGVLYDLGIGSYYIFDQNVTKGVNVFNITTLDTVPHTVIRFNGIGFNASNIVVTEAIDADFDYFKGLSSTYESCYPGGKNLFDRTKVELGYWGVDSVTYNTNIPSVYSHKTPIKVKPNTNYTISSKGVIGNVYIVGLHPFDSIEVVNNSQSYFNTGNYSEIYVQMNDVGTTNSLDEFLSVIQLEEGSTVTSYEPFIDKYRVDVKVTGKNLFDKSKVIYGKYQNCAVSINNFTLATNSNYNVSGLISVKPNKTYTQRNFNGGHSAFYDINKNPLRNIVISTNTFTTPNNCYYVMLNMSASANIDTMQIEEGTQATSYEPYFESTKTFYLNSPLLEGDKIITKNGKVYHYHKMGMVVLDGSEDWKLNINSQTTQSFRLSHNIDMVQNLICDRFIHDSISSGNDIEGILISKVNTPNEFSVEILKTKLVEVSITGFKKWLQANPTTVVYELASPYYELIDEYNNTILNIPNTVAHLTHTSIVPVNNTIFTNYKDELNVLEPNTQYRVMFDCDIANIPFTVTLGGTSQEVTSIKGTHSLLITTPSELVDKNLVIDGIGRCGIDNIRIFKGNAEYDYVKGLWSGYEERKLENLLKDNLINIQKTYTISNDSMLINDEKGIDKIEPNTVYTYICKVSENTGEFLILNNNETRRSCFTNSIRMDKKVGIVIVKMKSKSDLSNCTMPIRSYITKGSCTIDYAILLEGDWTDNPPTYEEVMTNEGKYAVKVKLDNSNAFGKGGRL